jgi:hypothetical protein
VSYQNAVLLFCAKPGRLQQVEVSRDRRSWANLAREKWHFDASLSSFTSTPLPTSIVSSVPAALNGGYGA